MSYLAQLRAAKGATSATDKTDKSPSVTFGSSYPDPFPPNGYDNTRGIQAQSATDKADGIALPVVLAGEERLELYRLARRWHELTWPDERETQETIARLRRASPASLVIELAEFRALVAGAQQ